MSKTSIPLLSIKDITTSISFMQKSLVTTLTSISKDQKTVDNNQEKRPFDTFISKNRYKYKSLHKVGANLYERLYRFEELLKTSPISLSIEVCYYELMQELALFNEMRFQAKKAVFPLFSDLPIKKATVRRLAVA